MERTKPPAGALLVVLSLLAILAPAVLARSTYDIRSTGAKGGGVYLMGDEEPVFKLSRSRSGYKAGAFTEAEARKVQLGLRAFKPADLGCAAGSPELGWAAVVDIPAVPDSASWEEFHHYRKIACPLPSDEVLAFLADGSRLGDFRVNPHLSSFASGSSQSGAHQPPAAAVAKAVGDRLARWFGDKKNNNAAVHLLHSSSPPELFGSDAVTMYALGFQARGSRAREAVGRAALGLGGIDADRASALMRQWKSSNRLSDEFAGVLGRQQPALGLSQRATDLKAATVTKLLRFSNKGVFTVRDLYQGQFQDALQPGDRITMSASMGMVDNQYVHERPWLVYVVSQSGRPVYLEEWDKAVYEIWFVEGLCGRFLQLGVMSLPFDDGGGSRSSNFGVFAFMEVDVPKSDYKRIDAEDLKNKVR